MPWPVRQRSRQTLAHYAETAWFPNHLIEATTREKYRYMLDRYVLPGLGHIRMIELLPFHVREWITDLQSTHGARPPTVREAKVVLDAILTAALNDQVVMLHAGEASRHLPWRGSRNGSSPSSSTTGSTRRCATT